MLDHVEVLRVQDERSPRIFLNLEILARTLFLDESIAPAARLSASALVARTTCHSGAEQASSRIRNTHSTMHEHFDLEVVGHVRTHLSNVGKAHLPSTHHTTRPKLVPHTSRLGVHDRCLGAHMQLYMRCMRTRERERSQIADDERIDTCRVERFHVFGQLRDVARVHERVERHMHLDVAVMRIRHNRGHLIQLEVVGTRPHAKLVACEVNRIGTEADGCLQLAPATCRRQQLGFTRHLACPQWHASLRIPHGHPAECP